MIMIHATPAANLAPILRSGILAGMSKGRAKTVWVTGRGRKLWTLGHVHRRHGTGPVALIQVSVPKGWLKKGGRHGMKHTGGRDIPPDRIGSIQIVTTTLIQRGK